MYDRLREILSVCIFGDAGVPEMEGCVKSAERLTDRIFFAASAPRKGGERRVSMPGVRVLDAGSLSTAMETEWVLFVGPGETAKTDSPRELYLELSDEKDGGFIVCVKDETISGSLCDYRFIGNLGQYENMGEQARITRLECRLVKKDIAGECLDSLTGGSGKIGNGITRIIENLHIEKGRTEVPETGEDAGEHDMRHLKGEIYYGPVQNEGIDELSSGYIGFRVLHERYLESFMESASSGFGIDGMYLPMVDHLNKKGNFEGSRVLLDAWTENRFGDETAGLCRARGFVYGHLLMLDEAIACYKRSNDFYRDPSIYAMIGELYLVKGDRENAVKFFRESVDMRPSPFHARLLAVIEDENWKPPTLSLCMIAKDEEKTMERALSSVRDIVDEIVVADTGSSDGTREIIRKYGGRVIESEWRDDFSAARNDALDEAGGDYVLFLDADEFIDIGDRLGLALLKRILPPEGDAAYRVRIRQDERLQELSVSLMNGLMKEEPASHQVRLLPGARRLFFTGAAFESPDLSLGRAGIQVLGAPLFRITHGRENGRFRDERNVPAVGKSLDSVDDPVTALKGGLFFLKMGDLNGAFPWFEKSQKVEPDLSVRIAKLYASQGLYERAEALLRKAMGDFADSAKLAATLAGVFFENERYEDVCEVLKGVIDSGDIRSDSELYADALYYYGISLIETGRTAPGVGYLADALERDPLDTRYRIGGLYALAMSEQWDRFLEAAEGIVNQEGITVDFEIGDFADIGRLVFMILRHLSKGGKRDEPEICRKILKHLIRTRIVRTEEIGRMEVIMEEANRMISCAGY